MPDDVPVLSTQLQELKDLMLQQMGTLTEEVRGLHHSIESVEKRVSALTGRIQQLETNPPKPDNNKDEDDDDDGFQELEADVVYSSNSLLDHIKPNTNRLRRR